MTSPLGPDPPGAWVASAGLGPVLMGPSAQLVAPMGTRLIARLIDALLVGGVLLIAAVPLATGLTHAVHTVHFADGTSQTTFAHGAVARAYGLLALAVVLSMLYDVALVAMRGATLGKQWTGLKVVRAADGGLPGWGPAFIRWLVPAAAAVACSILGAGLVYASPFFDSTHRNQGWQDKAAHTFVIKRH